jgi:hypothetical protein
MRRLWVCALASVLVHGAAKGAIGGSSDIIGVRQLLSAGGGIFHDQNGNPVADQSIAESTPEMPESTSISFEINVAHGLPNKSDVFLNTTGFVYLTEPVTNGQLSDQISIVFTPDPQSFFLVSVDITLVSDPTNLKVPVSGKNVFDENGNLQDITGPLFDVAQPGAAHPVSNSPGTYPFSVIVQSDVETPEPSSIVLLAVGGLVVLGCAAPWRRPRGQAGD